MRGIRMRSEDYYQISLIVLALVAVVFFGVFLFRELNPEYKIYQKDYVDLENFRSTYTGRPPPPFKYGVKQIVIPQSDKGPETIDRCVSCHVALQFEHFSPTMIARDVNGNIVYDKDGIPKKVKNPNFIWAKLDQKIADLQQQGKDSEAKKLESLKTAHVRGHDYDVEKVLIMHPLIGRETRPFEYHPVDEYGCTVCHGGNGRGLVTDRAHGPVYDGTYEETYMGPEPEFLEKNPLNDPVFSKVFNHKPGHRLLFQTSPLLVGGLIQSRCVQCHQPTTEQLSTLAGNVERVAQVKSEQIGVIRKGFEQDYNALISLLSLRQFLKDRGINAVLTHLRERSKNYTLSPEDREKIEGNIQYLRQKVVFAESDPYKEQAVLKIIDQDLLKLLGSSQAVDEVQKAYDADRDITLDQLWSLLQKIESGNGTLHQKGQELEKYGNIKQTLRNVKYSVNSAAKNSQVVTGLSGDIDRLTRSYQRGEQLFVSQACYACHKISGMARGGIGPELTEAGYSYPWFLKESIVWPQADLKTSTMPNYKLDHEELEDLMTFLLAQRPNNPHRQNIENHIAKKEWEEGKQKSPWEKPLPPNEIRNIRDSMVIFATQGCAACHRLEGFESNVGFAIEKNQPTFDQLYAESQWFRQLIPEDALGSSLVSTVEKHRDEIDQRIVSGVREHAILDEIEEKFPHLIESYYSPFKYALRAHNHLKDTVEWKERIRRVMLMYIQEYGLGRLVGPRPNWSGIYRSDKWLMEHFWNPSSLIARSIMPVFPFDNSKFLALTYMLDDLGQKNRDRIRQAWKQNGFNAALAYERLCSQCHGETLRGDGPVAEWIYPIPKNLGNPIFLRHLTKDRVVQSIMHGVNGTPMPPWGETASGKDFKNTIPVLTREEIIELVNWIYRDLPGEKFLRELEEVKKWEYQPEEVIKELQKSGDLQKLNPHSFLETLPKGNEYLVSLKPMAMQQPEQGTTVEDIFDKIPDPLEGPDKYQYYIKKKYYTEKNLRDGKAFFELNCAVCHGTNADGAGQRAGVMEDAKPRMLINLPWIESRDDLRLIRSIVFGVKGTSMIPWGDQTTALQRLQLVMYIRSLTQSKRDYEQLTDLLFQVFEEPLWVLQDARAQGSEMIQILERLLYESKTKRMRLEGLARKGQVPPNEITEVYSSEVQNMKDLEIYQQADQQLTALIDLVKKEKELYKNLGDSIFNLYGNQEIFQDLLKTLRLNKDLFSYHQGRLAERQVDVELLDQLKAKIIDQIRMKIRDLSDQKLIEEGKISTKAQKEALARVSSSLGKQNEMLQEIISTFAQIERIRMKQNDILTKINQLENSHGGNSNIKI